MAVHLLTFGVNLTKCQNHKPATAAQATRKKRTSTIQTHVVAPQGKIKKCNLVLCRLCVRR